MSWVRPLRRTIQRSRPPCMINMQQGARRRARRSYGTWRRADDRQHILPSRRWQLQQIRGRRDLFVLVVVVVVFHVGHDYRTGLWENWELANANT